MLLIVFAFILGMNGCSTPSAKTTLSPTSINSDKNIGEGDAASTIDKATNTDNPAPTESLSPTGIPIPSKDKEVQIGFELNSYEKEDMPYTDVNFIIHSGKEEEKILIGSYLGGGFSIESFENREFFNTDSIVGCQVYYAGGGDNVFAYLKDSEIVVKHIEFVEGNEEMDSEAIKEEVVFTRKIPENSIVKTFQQNIDSNSTNDLTNNDITLEDIKKIMLEANALLDKLYKGGNCSSEIIGNEDGTDVYGYTGSYNTFDKLKQLFGDYYSDIVIEKVLYTNGFINLFGTVGIIGADGDAYYNIEANSKIKVILNEDNKMIVDVEEFGETDDGVDNINTSYTLEKQASGKWMITDMDLNNSYNEIEKQLYYNDEFTLMASSQKDNYPSINALDDNLQTAWAEGVKGDGIDEWLEFEATNNYDVSGIKIINGYAKSDELYYANNRIKKIKIELPDNTVIERELEDGIPDYQTIDFEKVVNVKNIKITILEVYPGSKYSDTCISEIKVFR